MARLDYKAIGKDLERIGGSLHIPLGKLNKGQLERLRKRFPDYKITIPAYDPFGAYVVFERKETHE